MNTLGKIWQALAIIFIGNLNFLFVGFCMDAVDFKGILPFIIFLPYLFAIIAMKLLLYDTFGIKIKRLPNKITRIIGLIIMILFFIIIAIMLQTAIYYIIMESGVI